MSGEDCSSNADGFSLLEMIVIMTIISLVAAVTLFATVRKPAPTTLSAALKASQALALRARQKAMLSRDAINLLIDADRRVVSIEGMNAKTHFAASTELRVTTASALSSQTAGRIQFYPDGSSSGGTLEAWQGDGPVHRLTISWATGLPSLAIENR